MDGDLHLDRLAFSKFAVGQPVPRNEDPMLVRGQGVYTGLDLTAAGIKNMPLGMAIPTADGSRPHRPSCPVLTIDKVRYVGDPIPSSSPRLLPRRRMQPRLCLSMSTRCQQ